MQGNIENIYLRSLEIQKIISEMTPEMTLNEYFDFGKIWINL